MTRAERELRREILVLRAAVERTELAAQLASIDARTRVGRTVAGALLGRSGPAASGWLGLAATALRVARSQPWIVPTVAGGLLRVARSRPLRWIALAGIVAGVVWWARGNAPAAGSASGDDGAG
jgi:hypothetical protein